MTKFTSFHCTPLPGPPHNMLCQWTTRVKRLIVVYSYTGLHIFLCHLEYELNVVNHKTYLYIWYLWWPTLSLCTRLYSETEIKDKVVFHVLWLRNESTIRIQIEIHAAKHCSYKTLRLLKMNSFLHVILGIVPKRFWL